MKALSIRQPWAWAILHAGKRIENRSWSPEYRGPVLLHAAKGCGREEYIAAAESMIVAHLVESVPPLVDLMRGGIVGRANLVDVISTCNSDEMRRKHRLTPRDIGWWQAGRCFGLILADIEPLPFRPLRGALGLFNVSDELVS